MKERMAAQPEAVIEVRDLRRSFGSFAAVKGVSFTVDAGEVFGLLGPNGAGKTTIVKMLTTLLPPDGGEAKICGCDVRRQASRVRRCIGYVPQALSVDGALTQKGELLALFFFVFGGTGQIVPLAAPASQRPASRSLMYSSDFAVVSTFTAEEAPGGNQQWPAGRERDWRPRFAASGCGPAALPPGPHHLKVRGNDHRHPQQFGKSRPHASVGRHSPMEDDDRVDFLPLATLAR